MSFTSRLVNYKRKEVISGQNKTTFFTEVNTDVKVGDKVFISNGNYDTNDLILQDEYQQNASGYRVLKIDGCAITLDIDWDDNSPNPYEEISPDDCIKIWTVSSQREFDYYNDILVNMDSSSNKKFNEGYGNYIYTIATVSNGTYSLISNRYWSVTGSNWTQVSMIPPKIQSYQQGLAFAQISDYPTLSIPVDKTLLSYTSSPSTPPGQTTTINESGYIHGKYAMDIGDNYRLTATIKEGGILDEGGSTTLEIWQAQDTSNKNAISTSVFNYLDEEITIQIDFVATNSYVYLKRSISSDTYSIKLDCSDFYGTFDTYGRPDGYNITLVNGFGSQSYTTSGLADTTFLDDFILFEYVPQLLMSPIATYYDITTNNLSSGTGEVIFTAKFFTPQYEILSTTHSAGAGSFFSDAATGNSFIINDFKLFKKTGQIETKTLSNLIVLGDKYTNNSTNFIHGPLYSYNGSNWVINKKLTQPILSKSNFRNGIFQSGIWYDGLYGTYEKKISWNGLGEWKSGIFLNSTVEGLIESKTKSDQKTDYAKFENNVLQQSTDFTNNKGYGYNFFIDSEFVRGTINSSNFVGGEIIGTMSSRPVKRYYQLQNLNNSVSESMNGFTSSINVMMSNLINTKVINTIISNSTLNSVKSNELYITKSNIFNSDIFNSVASLSTFDSNSEMKIESAEISLISFGTQSFKNIKLYSNWDKIKNLNFGRKIYLENFEFNDDFKINNVEFGKNYLYVDSNTMGVDYNIAVKSSVENSVYGFKSSVDIRIPSSSTQSIKSMFNSYIRTGYFDGVFNGTYKGNWINDKDFILKSSTMSYNISHNSTSSLSLTLMTYSGKSSWWTDKLSVGDIINLDNLNYIFSSTQSYTVGGAFEIIGLTVSNRSLTLSPIGFSLPNLYGGTYSYIVKTSEFENKSSSTLMFNDVYSIGDNDQLSILFGTSSYPFVFKFSPTSSNDILLNPGAYNPFEFDWLTDVVVPTMRNYISEFYDIQSSSYNIIFNALESGQEFNIGFTLSLATQSAISVTNSQSFYNDTLVTYHGLSKIYYKDSVTQNGRFARVGSKKLNFGIGSNVYNTTFNNINLNSTNQANITTSIFDLVNDSINQSVISNSLISNSLISNSVLSNVYWSSGTMSNSILNNSSYNKQNDKFIFKDIYSFWGNGQSINSTFSSVYWHDGKFNGGLFTNGTWRTGNWYSGNFGNQNNKSDSNVFLFGNWYGGYLYNSTFGSETTTTLPWGDNAGVVYNGSGTVSGITGSSILTGVGTYFTKVKPGYLMRIDNKLVSIVSISSNTQMVVDTTWSKTISQNSYQAINTTNWYNGNFESGTFRGRNNTERELVPNSIWYNGIWKNGTFLGNSIWKNGTFLGGKFVSVYGGGTSSNIIDFAWHNGVFKSGQFGDSRITRREYIKFPFSYTNGIDDRHSLNTSWYDGFFDGGLWNGNVWNNGTFSNGTFDGRPLDSIVTLNDGKRTTNKLNLALNSNFLAKSDLVDRSNWKQVSSLINPYTSGVISTQYNVGTASGTDLWYYNSTGGMSINSTSGLGIFGFVSLYQPNLLNPGISYDIEITYKSSGFNNIVIIDEFTYSYPNFRIGPGYDEFTDKPVSPAGKQLILKNTNSQTVTEKIYGITVSSIQDLVISANNTISTIYSINVYESVINNYPEVSNNLISNPTFSNNSNWIGYTNVNSSSMIIVPGLTSSLGPTNSFWYTESNNGLKLQITNPSIPNGTTFSLQQDLPIKIGRYYDIELTYNTRPNFAFKGANGAYGFTIDIGEDNRSYSIVEPTIDSIEKTVLIENRYASSNRIRIVARRDGLSGWINIKNIQLRERVSTWRKGNVVPSSLTSNVQLKSIRWESGEFNHNKSQIIDGIWYDGVFRNGEWVSGIFNPYSRKNIDNGINVLLDPKFKNNRGEWKVSTSGTVPANGLSPVTSTSSIYNWKITQRGIEKTYNSQSWYLEQRNVVDYGKFYNVSVTAAGSGSLSFKLGDINAGTAYSFTVSNVEQTFSFGLTASSGGLGLKQFVILPGTFNGYIKEIRMVYGNAETDTYNLDDTCYWENGTFTSGDFNLSEFKNGLVRNGNFTSAIIKFANWLYGNAYNVIWEDGRWRNGNWYGSPIRLQDAGINNSTGVIENNMIRQQLLNNMRYYNDIGLTSSNDIFHWNMFGYKTIVNDTFSSNIGWILSNATISGGNLTLNGASIASATLQNATRILGKYKITLNYTTSTNNVWRLGTGRFGFTTTIGFIPSGTNVTTSFEGQGLGDLVIDGVFVSTNLVIHSLILEEYSYTTYNNVSVSSSTYSFNFNIALGVASNATSSLYSNKLNSPIYGQIGNGSFIMGQWEYGNWISGKREDTKSINLDLNAIISWGRLFKNVFTSFTPNTWFVTFKSNVNVASRFKVGDKITIGNVTYIDVNDNRKFISIATITSMSSTQFVINFESPSLIKSVEQDSSTFQVKISKNNWLGGVFLNGVFKNGIFSNGYVKGMLGTTRITDTIWVDGKLDGGYVGGSSLIQNANLRLHTKNAFFGYSFLTHIDVPYGTSNLSNIFDVYGNYITGTYTTNAVLSSVTETVLQNEPTNLNLGSKFKKYSSPINSLDAEFTQKGGWNTNLSNMTLNINNGLMTFASDTNLGVATSSLTYSYTIERQRYLISEFGLTAVNGMTLVTTQSRYTSNGNYIEYYYGKDNLGFKINRTATSQNLSLDYARVYEVDMIPFYRYFESEINFYYSPFAPYTFSSPYINLEGNNDVISTIYDTYILPDNTDMRQF